MTRTILYIEVEHMKLQHLATCSGSSAVDIQSYALVQIAFFRRSHEGRPGGSQCTFGPHRDVFGEALFSSILLRHWRFRVVHLLELSAVLAEYFGVAECCALQAES
eukprot:symbB.v1.2.019494.t1/scaffold1595.1/size109920/3